MEDLADIETNYKVDIEIYTLAELSWNARQGLEKIAGQTPVMAVDAGAGARWNARTWVQQLLERAKTAGILTSMQYEPAIRAAVASQAGYR